MGENITINIYGDSVMKATVPDGELHYHFRFDEYAKRFETLPVTLVSRAKFGATVQRGASILERDLQKGLNCRYALLEYGGNDCNFNWAEVAETPEAEHSPQTELGVFTETLSSMADALTAKGVQPVLMTLPPIDAEKYFRFITRGGLNGEKILKWLGDVQVIYRFQELYSDAVSLLAAKKGLPCVDVRSCLLPDHRFDALVPVDGIHPAEPAYERIFGKLYERLKEALSASPVLA